VCLDPTDSSGALSERCGGLWWPFDVTVDIAYINEPPPGAAPNVEFVEMEEGEGSAPGLVIVKALADIPPEVELFVDYGPRYDRSDYV